MAEGKRVTDGWFDQDFVKEDLQIEFKGFPGRQKNPRFLLGQSRELKLLRKSGVLFHDTRY